MIPALALMFACYGSARLLNDGLKKHTGKFSMAFTWIIGALAIVALWILAIEVNAAGLTAPQ